MKYTHTKMGKISTIGLGCLQITNPNILIEAYKSGVNFFVTAEAYGDKNQKLIGDAFSKHRPKPFFATKVGINFTGKNAEEQFTQSREQIRSSVNKCSLLLGKSPLDLVGLHRLDDIHQFYIADGQNSLAWEIALDELINLQEAGKICHIGLSEPTAEQLEQALVITKARGTSIASIESAYSIVTRRVEVNGVKAICDREGITLIAYSSVMRGLIDQRLQEICLNDFNLSDAQFQLKTFTCLKITGDFARENIDMFSHDNIKHNVRLMLNFHQLASQYHVTPSQLALAWIQHKGAIPIPGTDYLPYIIENNESADKIEILEKAGAFLELDRLFPYGTFLGDPNPISISGVLDANSEKLNWVKKRAFN